MLSPAPDVLTGGGLRALTGGMALPIHGVEHQEFFRVGRRKGRWLFLSPEGKPFFSLALNHIDPSPLRAAEGAGPLARKVRQQHGARWLQRGRGDPDLADWGFNSVGWVQEWVTTALRHSRELYSYEEYQWLGLPYCHRLPFAEFHQWDGWSRHPDLARQRFRGLVRPRGAIGLPAGWPTTPS